MSGLRELIERVEKLEAWRPVPGWPYEASSQGRLKSSRTGQVLRPAITSKGYEKVCFQVANRRKDFRVHRVVFEAWHYPLGDLQVNHIDGNKRNNRPENLEAVTAQENIDHAGRTGLRPRGDDHWSRRSPEQRPRGERIAKSKLNEEQVKSIRAARERGETLSSLADTYGVDKTAIWQIVKRKVWAHV